MRPQRQLRRFNIRVLAAGLLLLCAAAALAIPSPPTVRNQRFGIYFWNTEFPGCDASSCGTDRLLWGANLVAQTGSRTMRVYLGPQANSFYWRAADGEAAKPVPSGLPEDRYYLARLVAGANYPSQTTDTPYARLFRDSRFDTFLLTVYSLADDRGDWANGFDANEQQAEIDQINELGRFLLDNFGGKRFILLNWEGDNQVAGWFFSHPADDPDTVWNGFAAWIQSRAAGVACARGDNPSGPGCAGWNTVNHDRLLSGLEFNLVHRNGQDCALNSAAANRCVISYVGSRSDVGVDYYSYSSWETLAVEPTDPATLRTAVRNSLNLAKSLVQAGHPAVDETNFILGELGFARTQYGECAAAQYLKDLVESFDYADAFHVSYGVFWQVVDNLAGDWRSPGASFVDLATFGLYRRDGSQSELWRAYQSLLAGGSPGISISCPRLDGLVNPADNTRVLREGGQVSLTGANFWSSHLVVQQGPRYSDVYPAGQSSTQITATLPSSLLPGRSEIFVVNGDGLQSNALPGPIDYEGCYTDDSSRALPALLASGDSVESCIQRAAAAGYAYAGLQYYGQCFAGNTLGYVRLDNEFECSTQCSANPAEFCGGPWRNSIYRTYASPSVSLSIAKAGTGGGTVTSSPAGVNCGSACTATFARGTAVTLYASPNSTCSFAGWSGGGCSGTGNCTTTLNQSTTVTATFNAAPPATLSVSVSGSGTVTSSPAGISCPGTCSANFTAGTYVTLSASPGSGSVFAGWSGACSGTGGCGVTMNQSTSVGATFVSNPTVTAVTDSSYSYTLYTNSTIVIWGSNFTASGYNTVQLSRAGYTDVWLYQGDGHYYWDYATNQINASLDNRAAAGWWTLTVRDASGRPANGYAIYLNPPPLPPQTLTVSVSGSGTVSSSPGGIYCSGYCSASFAANSYVTLYASPSSGWSFAGWSGACSGTGSCTVYMSQAWTVYANFSMTPTGPVINAITDGNYQSTIYTWSTIIVWGNYFTPSGGNTVQLSRSGYPDVWMYQGDGHYYWDYSTGQINGSLDYRAASGWWLVTVRDAQARPSPGFWLYIN